MKNIRYIVVHCTATPAAASVEDVRRNWLAKEQHHILQSSPFLIKREGEVKRLFHIGKKHETKNSNLLPVEECLHIAYIGGLDNEGKPVDNRTQRQKDSLFDKLVELSERYPDAKIVGSDSFTNDKSSPAFDVKEWLHNYRPDFLELEYETQNAA